MEILIDTPNAIDTILEFLSDSSALRACFALQNSSPQGVCIVNSASSPFNSFTYINRLLIYGCNDDALQDLNYPDDKLRRFYVKYNRKKGWCVMSRCCIAKGAHLLCYLGELIRTPELKGLQSQYDSKRLNYVLTIRELSRPGEVQNFD